MAFFGVRDRQERDTYRYFLEFIELVLRTHRRRWVICSARIVTARTST